MATRLRPTHASAALLVTCAALAGLAPRAHAQGPLHQPGWELGGVFDVAATSREIAFGQRGQGLGLARLCQLFPLICLWPAVSPCLD